MSKLIDLTGQRFGRLVVIKRNGSDGNRNATWDCCCDCGNKTVVSGSELRRGRTKSCGCLVKELTSQINYKHGEAKTRLYYIWQGMKERTQAQNSKHYKNYGGRGITVCDEWQNDFVAFETWALSNGYSDDLTIDRKDNNKGYSPHNCRWVNREVQGNNRRDNYLITHNKQTNTLSEWARIIGINKTTLINRINVYGWPIEKALTTPVKKRK